MPYFTTDWWSEHVPSWEKHVAQRFSPDSNNSDRRKMREKRKRCLRFLAAAGTYEGRTLLWMFDNVLGDKGTAVVLDDFDCDDDNKSGGSRKNPDVRGTFAANTAPFRGRVKLRPTAALVAMRAAKKEQGAYDVVYIDTRSSKHAMETAVLAFPLLAPGGVLVFTNYTHSKERDARCPRRGIDGFIDAYSNDLKVLRNGFHTFLERRVKPLPHAPCFSEYFEEPTGPTSAAIPSTASKRVKRLKARL